MNNTKTFKSTFIIVLLLTSNAIFSQQAIDTPRLHLYGKDTLQYFNNEFNNKSYLFINKPFSKIFSKLEIIPKTYVAYSKVNKKDSVYTFSFYFCSQKQLLFNRKQVLAGFRKRFELYSLWVEFVTAVPLSEIENLDLLNKGLWSVELYNLIKNKNILNFQLSK